MRRLLLLLAWLALLPPERAAAEARLVFGSSGVAEFPFDLHNNHINVRGRIGDSDSLWIVLDSGASGASVSASRARSLGLAIQGGGTAQGAGGSVESGRVPNATIRLPGLELVGQDLSSIPLDGVALQTGRPMDVIVGHALLDRAVVEIDYAARKVRVFDPSRPRPDSPAGHAAPASVTLPLAFHQDLPYVKATVELPGRSPIEGQFVLDTGAATAFSLAAEFVQDHHALDAVPRTIRTRMGGVGGMTENRVGRIDRLRLGALTIEKPVTVFRLPSPGRISAPGTAGNIGAEILRRFRVTFDYPRHRVTFEPNAAFTEPYEADMSGLVTQVLPDSARALQVMWTQDGSPAAEAGIAAGDVIEAVDGHPVAELEPPAIREMFRRPDSTYTLTVRRGSERREVKLTTRRLI